MCLNLATQIVECLINSVKQCLMHAKPYKLVRPEPSVCVISYAGRRRGKAAKTRGI